MVSTKEAAKAVVSALDSKKGSDIHVIDISAISTLADYFVICTGTSNTHINTLCDAVEVAMEQIGDAMVSREGHRSGTWVLLDYGGVVVHVFTDETRKFYDLERLWSDGAEVTL